MPNVRRGRYKGSHQSTNLVLGMRLFVRVLVRSYMFSHIFRMMFPDKETNITVGEQTLIHSVTQIEPKDTVLLRTLPLNEKGILLFHLLTQNSAL